MKKVRIAFFKDLFLMKAIESNEELVNISEKLQDCECICHKPDMEKYTGHAVWVRKLLADKLERVSLKLIEKFPDYKLKIVYGYRHPEVQSKYFLERRSAVAIGKPHLSDFELDEIVHFMVAVPSVAGHPTGGAVDVTIATNGGDLDMGTRVADYSDTEKILTFSKSLTKEQQENRKLMHDLMVAEEFCPFYGEWWHFSFGDKEWAWFYEKPNAIYDQIDFRSI